MRVEIYWITENLAIMPRPRGGDWLEDEINSLEQQNVSVIVSLLEREEVEELNLQNEEMFCCKSNIDFLSFPIPDRHTPPSVGETKIFVGYLRDLLTQNKKIVIHCRQGVGRSSLIAACVLASENAFVDETFGVVAKARRCAVPDTPQQIEWVRKFISPSPNETF